MDTNSMLGEMLLARNMKSQPSADMSYAETFDERFESSMMAMENPHIYRENLLLIKSKRSERYRYSVRVVDPECTPPKVSCRKMDVFHKVKPDFTRPAHLITNEYKRDSPSKCRYTADSLDMNWIELLNRERKCFNLPLLTMGYLEQAFTVFEKLVYTEIVTAVKEIESKALEFDEDACCAVCQSAEGEDENELVFCEDCLMCVHQACYGILTLPEESWICRLCQAGLEDKPSCALCLIKGGAMKLCDDKTQWCHVICALWVPEVAFGSAELMEPVKQLNKIPIDRKRLFCSLCKQRGGAPIQCCIAQCKTAFHVTCAVKHKLVMEQLLVNENVIMNAYCSKHSEEHRAKHKDTNPVTTQESSAPKCPKKELNVSEMLKELFHKLDRRKAFTMVQTNMNQKLCPELFESIYLYWKMKRSSHFYYPLIEPHMSWSAASTTPNRLKLISQCDEEAKVKALSASIDRLRRDLVRAKELSKLVVRREKLKQKIFLKSVEAFNLRKEAVQRHPTTLDEMSHNEQCSFFGVDSQAMRKSRETTQENPPISRAVPVTKLLTGNETVDSISPFELIVKSNIIKRIRRLFSKSSSTASTTKEVSAVKRTPLLAKNNYI